MPSARILLVEDELPLLQLLEKYLRRLGYEVEAHSQAVRALDAFTATPGRYDLVIADGKLPDGTGMDVADRAHAAGMRTLVITAYAFTLPAAARERYEILLKPLRPAELVTAVERALAGPASCPRT